MVYPWLFIFNPRLKGIIMEYCDHRDADGQKEYTWFERDARGIELGGMMCHKCEKSVMAENRRRYRADIFEDSDYWADERIEDHG